MAHRDGPTGTGGVFYYFSDHLKTASVITDSLGNIKSESDFYPWGGELQFVNGDSNHYKFTGKERDPETQLDYFGARYYSNGLGRWISADWSPKPIPVPYADFSNPQSLNLYGFVGGNPASKADPDGHAKDNKSLGQQIIDALNSFGDALQHAHMGGSAAIPPPQPCACPSSQKQDNKQNNNNNSKSENTKEQSSSKAQTNKGEPAQLKAGKEAHKSEAVRPGEKAEVRTPSGKRMDRYNKDATHIREIKPDNARGEAAGQKQLDGYKKEMDQATGKDHN